MDRHSIIVFAACLTLAVCAACSGGKAAPRAASEPSPAQAAATPTAVADGLKHAAESKYLAAMSKPLADEVRAQPWYGELDQARFDLVAAIEQCERAAQGRGETRSVADALEFASEQPWYADGLDDTEAAALRGVFYAYAESLSNQHSPAVGPQLANVIQYQLEDVLQLPESGEMVLLVAAQDPDTGRKALRLAADALPRVEQIVGKFPYDFLFISVTDLPQIYAGLSYDQFIAIAPNSVDAPTIIHEITHSTLYGIFPTWFEEGFAHFVEYYLTTGLDAGVSYFTSQLAQLEASNKLYVGPDLNYSFIDYVAERAQGFLFLKGFYDTAGGIDSVSSTIRSLRTKTFNDQDLIRTLIQNSPPDRQPALRKFVCQDVRGTAHDYCADN